MGAIGTWNPRRTRRCTKKGCFRMSMPVGCFFALRALIMLDSRAAAATLVENGKARATIVLGAKARAQEKQAADELRVYVEKITGVALTVVTDAQEVRGGRVLIGRS